MITPNHKKKPFDDVRVRRALALAIDQWQGAPALSKIANVRTVGGVVFPGSPLAATKEELQKIAGYWPDIEKSRAEARRLLKEAGAEGLTFELLNRNVDQPYKYIATWVIDEWSKIGLKVTQKVLPTGPFFDGLRNRRFRRRRWISTARAWSIRCWMSANTCRTRSTTENYGNYEDQKDIDLYQAMLHETDSGQAACADAGIRDLRARYPGAHDHDAVVGAGSCPYRSYVKGWKISPSHYVNQDLATIWLDE